MRKVKLLPTRDCEAGYGPGNIIDYIYTLIYIYIDSRNCEYSSRVPSPRATSKNLFLLDHLWFPFSTPFFLVSRFFFSPVCFLAAPCPLYGYTPLELTHIYKLSCIDYSGRFIILIFCTCRRLHHVAQRFLDETVVGSCI